MPSPRRTAAIALLLPFLLAGCRHSPWGARAVAACPGPLVSTEAISGEFLWRYQVQIEAESGRFAFQLVVQKRGDELVLVGMHALGAKLFSVRQVGVRVDVDALPPPALAMPAENVLRDVHRLRFAPVTTTLEVVRSTDGAHAEIHHPACGYFARFSLLEERTLP